MEYFIDLDRTIRFVMFTTIIGANYGIGVAQWSWGKHFSLDIIVKKIFYAGY
jgi:hypothetical protein